MGVGASGLALAGAVARSAAPTGVTAEAASAEPTATPPAAQSGLESLEGQTLGPYVVESVGAIDRGGVPVILSTAAGARFRVDVLRFDPSDGHVGIGISSRVTVYLRNGGDGRTATDEEQGLGAMALADELLRRERAGFRPPAELLTRAERDALDRAV